MTTKSKQVHVHESRENQMRKGARTYKRPYLRPVLVQYGRLSILTAGGTGPAAEPVGKPHPQQHP